MFENLLYKFSPHHLALCNATSEICHQITWIYCSSLSSARVRRDNSKQQSSNIHPFNQQTSEHIELRHFSYSFSTRRLLFWNWFSIQLNWLLLLLLLCFFWIVQFQSNFKSYLYFYCFFTSFVKWIAMSIFLVKSVFFLEFFSRQMDLLDRCGASDCCPRAIIYGMEMSFCNKWLQNVHTLQSRLESRIDIVQWTGPLFVFGNL